MTDYSIADTFMGIFGLKRVKTSFYFDSYSCPKKDRCPRAYKCVHGYFDENFNEEPVVNPYVPLHVSGKGWYCEIKNDK